MRQNTLFLASALGLALAVGCGNNTDNNLVPAGSDNPPASTCKFDNPTVRPQDGAGPLHRTTPIAVTWKGEAGPLTIKVASGRHVVIGETIRGDTQAVFVPLGAYPENAAVQWTVRACGKVLQGSFAVGALMHPLEDLGATVGTRPFDVDLRSARWESPAPRDPFGELLLKWQLAPTFLVQFVQLDERAAVVALAPGVAAEDGTVRQDLTRPLQVARVSLLSNPYVTLTPKQLELALGTGSLALTDIELVLGLTDGGFQDGRLVAEVRVPGRPEDPDRRPPLKEGKPKMEVGDAPRGAVNPIDRPDDPCRILAALSAESCHPCPDGDGRCYTLVLSDVEGAPSKVRDLLDLPLGPAVLPPGTVHPAPPRGDLVDNVDDRIPDHFHPPKDTN